MFRNLGGGRFEELFDEAGPAIAAPHSSRGCAFGDFDNDGDIDIVIMNMNEPPSLLRNDAIRTKSLAEDPTGGDHFQRSAIGARVTARYGGRSAGAGLDEPVEFSFRQRQASALWFGRGNIRRLDVRWPNGMKQTFRGMCRPIILVVIREGVGIVATRKPPFTS